MFPSIARHAKLLSCNACIFNEDIQSIEFRLNCVNARRIEKEVPLLANALTLSKLARSSCQVSTTSLATFVVSLIYRTARCPFSRSRHASMSFLGFILAKWRAASNPRPTFAPILERRWRRGTCNNGGTSAQIRSGQWKGGELGPEELRKTAWHS